MRSPAGREMPLHFLMGSQVGEAMVKIWIFQELLEVRDMVGRDLEIGPIVREYFQQSHTDRTEPRKTCQECI